MAGDDREAKRRELRERAEKILAADLFAVLGVSRTASVEEVRAAFVSAAKTWHPDKVPPGLEDLREEFASVFARLEQARATLSDPSLRLRYASDLAQGKAAPAPGTAAERAAATNAEAALELRKAEALLKKQDTAGAESHARRAVQLAPTVADYQAFLIALQANKPDCDLERVRAFVAELDRLIARDERCERAFFVRGTLKKRLDLAADAARDFARAAELNPRNLDAAREVGLHQMRREKEGAAKTPPDDGGVGGFFRKLFKR